MNLNLHYVQKLYGVMIVTNLILYFARKFRCKSELFGTLVLGKNISKDFI
jgi:hypothetical protein